MNKFVMKIPITTYTKYETKVSVSKIYIILGIPRNENIGIFPSKLLIKCKQISILEIQTMKMSEFFHSKTLCIPGKCERLEKNRRIYSMSKWNEDNVVVRRLTIDYDANAKNVNQINFKAKRNKLLTSF